MIPSRSSSVSVGMPIMKYSFSTLQPLEKMTAAASRRSCSASGLLMTHRRRSVPASGARVKPLLRTPATARIISGVSVPMRSDGSEIETRLAR